ncbi:hypothetical protein CR513_20212, partial [Mucuna pruriens]
MKQLATSNLEFQQLVSSSNLQFQQNMTATIQDLKVEIGQLGNTMSELQSAGSSSLPSQSILNPRGNANAVTLRISSINNYPIAVSILNRLDKETRL